MCASGIIGEEIERQAALASVALQQISGVASGTSYFDDPDTAEPLRWLEACNEQVKDCMVALESMLDSRLDDLMAGALEEHQRAETVSLDSIR
jgi:hypothetical protein